jgi:invasion protein IalB
MRQPVYSPWAKFCGKGSGPGAEEVCFTGKDARTEAGQPVVAVALIEWEGEARKLFRVTLPPPLDFGYSARIVIDEARPVSNALFKCFANGCMADFEATPELVDRLRKGRMLQIQAVNLSAAVITFRLALVQGSENSFASANEGPPVDPKEFEEQKTWQRPLRGDFDFPRKRGP